MANRNSTNNNTSNNGGKALSITDTASYDWRHYLKAHPTCKGVPPWCFEHVPLHKEWQHIGVKGYKLEVALTSEELPKYCDVQDENAVFWIANAVKFCGFMAKVVYDGAEHIPKASRDQLSSRWINFVNEAKRVGYTTMHSYSIMPPKCMETDKLEDFDWRDYIFNKLVQKHSIPTIVTVNGELSAKYKSELVVGQSVEVLDRACISRMRLGEVIQLVGGRVHVRYWDSKTEVGKADFVCHERSPTIFPCGWSRTVGQEISAPVGYHSPILKDSTLQYLINYDNLPKINIMEGMKLEAVDPLNPSVISVATVRKVLNHGYFMATMDGQHTGAEKRKLAAFCYHLTSPLIFPCGYCEKRGLDLSLPKDYKGDLTKFTWDKYMEQTKSEALPIRGLRRDDTNNHGIKSGMKLEAVDIMEPHLICVASVTRVIGRLLKVSFDGWGEEYDQWMDVKSPDLFPMGWCEVNRYPLQYPPGTSKQPATTIIVSNGHNNNGH
ncbi:unnamed protein product [Orchesella dallaii]|uniref:Lethal(3)malignant brain tumor-like protein 2 n=1 Tax=Orchesella dallaii TaxID=48710 RepID=A0ABP1QR49_9HEXA